MKTSELAVINKVNIPVEAIENYINENIDRDENGKRKNISFNAFSCTFENIDCCSAYVPVNGSVEISLADERVHDLLSVDVQISTFYFFTCAKGKDEIYKVIWGTSLS
jgi:hypothetical protein